MATTTVPVLRRCCGTECAATIARTKFDQEELSQRVAALQALADETRLKMVRLLARHEALCVCEIHEAFDLGQPTISHHLKILRDAGVIDVERRGKWAYYALRLDALKDLSHNVAALS